MSKKPVCSFCEAPESEKTKLLKSPTANICGFCASVAQKEVLSKVAKKEIVPTLKTTIKKPHEIKAHLDRYVVGQEAAKRVLSVAVYNHYKRLNNQSKNEIKKSNILLYGPTGSGKTYIVETLAKVLDVPLVVGDSTSLTKAGYIGEDVESLVANLVLKANNNIKEAERGIIYIDEVDKLSNKSGAVEGKKDIGEKSVQESLLKIIEGSEVKVQVGKGSRSKVESVSTKNILFIFGGAFVGLLDDDASSKPQKTIGFLSALNKEEGFNEESKTASVEDFVNFGMIPEFMGRIPVFAKLEELSKEDLCKILIEPKGAILKQYEELFKMDGVALSFDKLAVSYIAEEAQRKGVGARGLKGIIEEKMMTLMYEIPEHLDSRKRKDLILFKITEDVLKGKKEWRSSFGELEKES